MNDTKGEIEKKELSFAEQMQQEIAERDKADDTLKKLKQEIEIYKWEKSIVHLHNNIERIKNALKDKIKKRQYTTKDNKNVVELEYEYSHFGYFRPTDEIKEMFNSVVRKMRKNWIDFAYEVGLREEEGDLEVPIYAIRPTAKVTKRKTLFFNKVKAEIFFEGKPLKLLEMLIEKLKSDGIIVERICNKDKSIVFEDIHEVKKYKKEHYFYDTIFCIKIEF